MLLALAFQIILLAAALCDLFTRRIPNWLTGSLALLFAAYALAQGLDWQAMGLHLLAGFTVLGLGFGLFALGYLGGGDAKLMASISLWLGFGHMADFLILTTLLGGLLALAFISMRLAAQHPAFIFLPIRAPKDGLPYGLAIAAAGLLAAPPGLTVI